MSGVSLIYCAFACLSESYSLPAMCCYGATRGGARGKRAAVGRMIRRMPDISRALSARAPVACVSTRLAPEPCSLQPGSVSLVPSPLAAGAAPRVL